MLHPKSSNKSLLPIGKPLRVPNDAAVSLNLLLLLFEEKLRKQLVIQVVIARGGEMVAVELARCCPDIPIVD